MAHPPISRARWQASLAFAGSLIVWWRFRGVLPVALVVFTTVFAVLAWLAPQRYAPVQRGLDFVTRAIVSGFSWVALSLVYFGLFTPLRIARSIVGRDPLKLKLDPAASSYLQALPTNTRPRFDRQF